MTAYTEYTHFNDILLCATPQSWLDQAVEQQALLLIDHAHCERKAAATALALIYRYADRTTLLHKLSRLAREELRHFEQVLSIMARRQITYRKLTASRYATGLHACIRTEEPARLVDTLIVGAFIEARSCERFAALIPHLDAELSQFYRSLCRAEARHFQDYLALAFAYSGDESGDEITVAQRITEIAKYEAELIETPDSLFRFHSGVPLLP